MFDRIDTRKYCVLDRFSTVSVCGYLNPSRVSDVDDGCDFLPCHFGCTWYAAVAKDSAGRDNFDEIGTASDDFLRFRAKLFSSACDTFAVVVGNLTVVDSRYVHVATAVRDRQVRPANLDPRPNDLAGIDAVANVTIDPGLVGTRVPDSREARLQNNLSVFFSNFPSVVGRAP